MKQAMGWMMGRALALALWMVALPALSTSLPDSSQLTGSTVTQAQFKAALSQWRNHNAALLGADGTAATARQSLGIDNAAINFNPRGAWVTATSYASNDLVVTGGIIYHATVAHTSGTFLTDYAAGKWVIHQGLTSDTGLEQIASMAALRATQPAARHLYLRGYFADGDGGGGAFYGVIGVAAGTYIDNGCTVIVPTGGNGSSAWLRVVDDFVSPKWCGAKADGVTSDVSAVNSAVAAVNVMANTGRSVTLRFPSGRYNLKAGITTKITADNVSIVGDNAVIDAESGSIFKFDNTVQMRRAEVRGFTFSYTVPTVDQNAVPIFANSLLYARISDIRVLNAPAVMYFNASSNLFIDGISGTTVNIAKNAIHFNSCAVVDIDNVSLITDAGLQPVNPATPYPNPPVSGNVFIRITGASDTFRIKSGVLSNRYHRAFWATVNPGDTLLNVEIDRAVFDYAYDKGIYIENLGSSINNISINRPYIQAMQGVGLHLYHTGGLTQNVRIDSPQIILSGTHSIYLQNTAAVGGIKRVDILNPVIIGGNRLNSGGIDVYAVNSRVNLLGGHVGLSGAADLGWASQANYGIYFSGCDQYRVTNVEAGGVSGSFIFTADPASDYRARLVSDNRMAVGNSVSANPDYETSTLVAVVSGATYANTSPFKEYVSMYGVSASAAATIEVNANQYSTRSEWSGVLMPGDTLKVTTAGTLYRRITRVP